MKKHIVFSLICTLFFMLPIAPFYLTPTVRVSFHALSDTGARVYLNYTQNENENIQKYFLEKNFCPKTSDFVFFDVPAQKLHQMILTFSVQPQQQIKIDQIRIEGKTTRVLQLEENDLITPDTFELSLTTPLDIEGKTKFSFFAAFVSAFFSFIAFYCLFRFKTARAAAMAIAGYFCFSFYFDTNLGKENTFFALLLIAGLYVFYRKAEENRLNKKEKGLLFGFSLIFSLLSLFAYSLRFSLTFSVIKNNMLFSVVSVAGETALAYALCFYLFRFLDYLGTRRNDFSARWFGFYQKYTFSVSFCFILSIYLILALIYYPGRISPDMILQLAQISGISEQSQHHPFLSTFLMGICFKTGLFLKDGRLGAFLYILLQSLICAAVFAACQKQIRRWELPAFFQAGTLIFFAAVPFGIFMSWGLKDILYSAFFTLFLLQTISFITENDRGHFFKNLISYILTGLMVCLLRKNGIYIILPTLLFLFFRTSHKKTAGITFLTVLTIYATLTQYVFPAMGFPPGSKKEIFSIPFQQTAFYVKQHGTEVTAEEYLTIDRVLSFHELGKNYYRYSSDPVKKTYKLNDAEKENAFLADYLFVWAKMFFKHPVTYFQAFLNQSSQYYTFIPNLLSLPSRGVVLTEWLNTSETGSDTLPLKDISDWLYYSFLWYIPILNLFYSCAFYTNFSILLWIYLLCRKKEKSAAPFVPVLISILVCVASPVNGLLRYAMPMIAAAPLILAFTVFEKKNPFLLDKK